VFSRRKFLNSTVAGLGFTSVSAFLPKGALAATTGTDLASGTWASVTDATLLGRVWAAKFTNVLPWALDPNNTVLAKALNLPASGVALNPTTPAGIGFIYNPDAGTANTPGVVPTYTIKAGEVQWPMLAPLGNVAGIPTTKTWGYGNKELETVFADGTGLPVTFPGRTFVVRRGAGINVNWTNDLVDANGDPLPHLLGIDQSISMQTDQTSHTVAPGTNQEVFGGNAILGVPIAVHHHGGDTAKEFDGGPDQWITPRRVQVGPGVAGPNAAAAGLKYTYDNNQEAAMTWYHDHGEGVTRINAYGGLAGLYVIRDNNEDKLVAQGKIQSGPYELPVVIQDKCFTADGNLAYAADPADYPTVGLTLPSPTHHPEQFGDIIVVNGMAWPKLDVEPREYRLRLLNGSDSRVYVLQFGFGGVNRRGGFNQYLPMFKISTDLGLLNSPVEMRQIVISPGERMDVVVDFGAVKAVNGKREVVVVNSGATPFPLGAPTVPNTIGAGTVMQFNVSLALNAATAAMGLPALGKSRVSTLKNNLVLRGLDVATPKLLARPAIPVGAKVRRVLLAEGVDEFGRLMPLLGSFQMAGDADCDNYPGQQNLGTMGFSQLPTETPKLGTTEVWEFWNNTVDAHPIHMHLVKFRLVNRELFGPSPLAIANGGAMVEVKPMINGWTGERLLPEMVQLSSQQIPPVPPVPAPADEQGWKDTILCYPGEVTRVVMKFDRPGKYVYHCHILAHEEHDMMRWYEVV